MDKSKLTAQEEFAVRVRRAVVKATQNGTTGYPETVVDGINLRLGQCRRPPVHLLYDLRGLAGAGVSAGIAWYCPQLYGMRLVRLLESARAKGTHI